jgi:hypothetical protein
MFEKSKFDSIELIINQADVDLDKEDYKKLIDRI